MLKFKSLFLSLSIMTLVFSCSNESDLTLIEEEIPTDEKVILNYKGQVYEVTTVDFEDPMFSVQNPFFYSVFKKELENKQYAVVENEDGSVTLFDSVDEMMKSKQIVLPNDELKTRRISMTTPEIVCSAAVTLWDDSGFHDRNYTFQTNSGTLSLPNLGCFYYDYVPYRGIHSFNDKISAIKLYNIVLDSSSRKVVVFLGYKDCEYKGSVLVCIAYPGQVHEHKKLGKIGWNDKLSSFKLLIADEGEYKSNDR